MTTLRVSFALPAVFCVLLAAGCASSIGPSLEASIGLSREDRLLSMIQSGEAYRAFGVVKPQLLEESSDAETQIIIAALDDPGAQSDIYAGIARSIDRALYDYLSRHFLTAHQETSSIDESLRALARFHSADPERVGQLTQRALELLALDECGNQSAGQDQFPFLRSRLESRVSADESEASRGERLYQCLAVDADGVVEKLRADPLTPEEEEAFLLHAAGEVLSPDLAIQLARLLPTYGNTIADSISAQLVQVYVNDAPREFISSDLESTITASHPTLRITESKDLADYRLSVARWEILPTETQSETVTYSSLQVGALNAALRMPSGASYLFDLEQSRIRGRFLASLSSDAESRTLGETLDRQWSSCSNARVVNVFGGVSPAGFVANEDMQQRCGKGTPVDRWEFEAMLYAALGDSIGASLGLDQRGVVLPDIAASADHFGRTN